MLQEPSPLKYQNPVNGILSPLIDSQYVKMHNKKVKQLEQRVDKYVQSLANKFPNHLPGSERRMKG